MRAPREEERDAPRTLRVHVSAIPHAVALDPPWVRALGDGEMPQHQRGAPHARGVRTTPVDLVGAADPR